MTRAKRINVALQGGGAHGAFTWGVLDRLLEEPEIEIAGISGTSAGALNGAAIKCGLTKSRAAAQDRLAAVWEEVGAITDPHFAPWLAAISPSSIASALEISPAVAWGDTLSRVVSPYASGPFYQNPLSSIVGMFNYDDVCGDQGPAFCICATNVRSGKIRIFSGQDITPDAIMASACLPTMFRAVEIVDPKTGHLEAYWDGGYTGNPALFPLFDVSLPNDIVVVNINPLFREDVPTSPRAIQNRINEISFNSSLLRELRAIEFVQRLLSQGTLESNTMKNVLIHMVADDALMQQLSVATKQVASPHVLHQLRAAGRAACEAFLRDHSDRIGVESSVNLREMFE